MPNQMIALGVRGPQLPDLSRVTQQYGNMMNVAAQQRAAQRQAEAFETQQQRTAQEMQFAAQQREEQRAAAELTNETAQVAYFRELSMPVRDDQTYQMWLGKVGERNPEWAAMIRQASPTYDAGYMAQLRADAEQFVNKSIATPTTEVVYAPGGEAYEARTGGIGAPTAREITVIPRDGAVPAAPPQPRDIGAAFSGMINTVTPDEAGPMMGNAVRSGSIPASEVDRLRAAAAPAARPQVDQFFQDQGVQITPTSFAPGSAGQPAAQPMSMEAAPQIIQAAVQNGNIGENDLQSLRQMVGAQYEPQLAQWMQQNNIRITPAGEPSMRSAVYRPGVDAAPQMQQVQSYAPGTQFRGRPPTLSPSQNPEAAGDVAEATREPIPQAGARAGATTASEETVRTREQLRRDVPRARGATDTAIRNLVERMVAIDDYLTHPYRNSILGPIEGNIRNTPVQFGERANVQALWNAITNNETLNELLEGRQQTETGASPLSTVSNTDVELVSRAASRLSQLGTPEAQVREMIRLRNAMYAALQNTVRMYNDTYGPVLSERPELRITMPDVAPTYGGSQGRRPQQQPRPRTSRGTSVTGTW